MKHLEIKNYKGIKHLTLSDLATINVILGNNNVGKSSLLEAISIGVTKGSLGQIRSILNSRGEEFFVRMNVDEKGKEEEFKSLLSLYPNRDREAFYDKPIEIIADGNHCVSIQLATYLYQEVEEEDGVTRMTRRMMSHDERIEALNSGLPSLEGIAIHDGEKKRDYLWGQLSRGVMGPQPRFSFDYVDSHNSSDSNPVRFDNIALTENEGYLLEALQLVEPTIRGINFLKDKENNSNQRRDTRVPYIIKEGSSERYKLSSMGDGINRILTIVLAMANCKNGTLLIDEIENGLHYTVQYALWRVILKMAKKLQIQLFATTHSMDSIRAMVALREKEEGVEEYMSCYYLQEAASGEVVSYRYSADKLEFLLNNGEDIR